MEVLSRLWAWFRKDELQRLPDRAMRAYLYGKRRLMLAIMLTEIWFREVSFQQKNPARTPCHQGTALNGFSTVSVEPFPRHRGTRAGNWLAGGSFHHG